MRPRPPWTALRILALLAVAGSAACGIHHQTKVTIGLPMPQDVPPCLDGLPVLILQSLSCGGVCGFTCAPGRWQGLP